MSESNIENETIKTKKVRSIKSFFSAPKKIKLEINNASDFDSSSDGKFF
jgi:hypothetical protein